MIKGSVLSLLSRKSWFYPFLIFLLWIITALVVDPAAEFPVNDDWAYARNVQNLAVNKKFAVDDWPAMTLVSQTLYGSLFAVIFGFSFTVLRISILLLAVAASVVLYQLIKRRTQDQFSAFILTIGFVFSQIFCALSFTFMTDIFFLSWLIFSVYALVRYLETQKLRFYIFFILTSVIATLCRQHGLLFPLVGTLPLLFVNRVRLISFLLAPLPFVISLAAQFGYHHFLKVNNISTGIRGLEFFINDLKSMNFTSWHIQLGDSILVVGWMLLPLSLLILFSFRQLLSGRKLLLLIPCAALVAFCCYRAFSVFPLGNVSTIEGIGPKFMKDTDLNIVNRFGVHPGFTYSVRAIAFFSAVMLLFSAAAFPKQLFGERKVNRAFFAAAGLFLLIYLTFIMVSSAYFDRYALPAAFFLLLINVPVVQAQTSTPKFILTCIVTLLSLISVFQVKDFMNWNRTRWTVIAYFNKHGIDEHYIDGGFEYNEWLRPAPPFPPAYLNKSWYGVDKDIYLVANGKFPGYRLDTFFTYRHYIPFTTDTLFALEKLNRKDYTQDTIDAWIKEIEAGIRNNSEWMINISRKAAEKGIVVDEVLRQEVYFVIEGRIRHENESAIEDTVCVDSAAWYNERIKYYETVIRNNRAWMDSIKVNAEKLNLTVDSNLRRNVMWLIRQNDISKLR